MSDIQHKTALVTGASRGMGLEWCRQLARRGYQVILAARSESSAQQAASLLATEGLQVKAVSLDVTDEKSIASLVQAVSDEFSHLDVLINNAGANPKDDPQPDVFQKNFTIDALDASEVLKYLHINSISPMLMIKHFRSLLKKSSDPKVINISSWLGSIGEKTVPGHYSYAGSKSLLNMFTKAVALEINTDNITCVAVNPGWVQTNMGGSKAPFTTEQAIENMIAHVLEKITISDTGKFLHYDGKLAAY